MPSISTSTTSPSPMKRFGSRQTPTPDGVPVMITSPGSSVNARDAWAIVWAMLKIMSRVCPPERLAGDCGAYAKGLRIPISSRVTIHGPSGQNVSRLLPRTPLSIAVLEVPGGDIVAAGVAEHVLQRRRLGHPARAAAPTMTASSAS